MSNIDIDLNNPKYYKTIQAVDIDGDGCKEIILRAKECLYAYKYNKSKNTWEKLVAKGPLWADDSGWDNPCYYETIQGADIDGDKVEEVLARSAYAMEDYKYIKYILFWKQLTNGPAWSNNSGWNNSCYYKTIQLGDIDGDGAKELIARSAYGIEAYKYDKNTNEWVILPNGPDFSNKNGWQAAFYYETIQLADIDGDGSEELIARDAYNILAYKYNKDSKSWTPLAKGPSWSNSTGWTNECYYKTIQTADIDGDGAKELIARNAYGITVHKYNKDTNSWIQLPNGPNWSDEHGWSNPHYYETIQAADIDGDGAEELIARSYTGIDVHKYNKDTNSWIQLPNGPAWTLANGFNQPSYYQTIQTADIDGDKVYELLGRNDKGFSIWKYNASSKIWTELSSLQIV